MVRAKKHLGQHFLRYPEIAARIAEAITLSTECIVEIGPGTGMLTQFLLKKEAQIYAYEVDSESVDYLAEHYPTPQLIVKEEDFLCADLKDDIPTPFVLIGNFPYNISTEIIFKTLENRIQIPQLVGMFQKEVAERICAQPGSKIYGITSVLSQLYYENEYLFTVEEEAFIPPPKVKSGVLRMTRKEEIHTVDTDLLKKIVKAGFNQRRKKLSNALKSLGIPKNLENHNFLNLRAEQLSVADYIELTKLWDD